MTMTIIAHRCGPDIYPEQTMASARRAMEQGADVVEMDIQFTADGVPVICHDKNALRTFGVDRLVSDMPLEAFQALRHAADRTYASHTLDDVLSTGLQPLLLHCKLSGAPIAEIVRHLGLYGYGRKATMGVLSPGDVAIARQVDADVQTLAFMPDETDTQAFLDAGVDIIRLWEPWVTPERVARVHDAGRLLWVMAGLPGPETVGYTTAEALLSWRDMGVDGVLVNDIAWACGVLCEA